MDNEDFILPMSRLRILKNTFVVSLSFLFIFAAFKSLSVLQSTLNKEDGLGTSSLGVIYVCFIVSSMFFPSILVEYLGCKWTIAASMVCYILYIAANMHAVGYLMYPASVIIGFGAAPLWSATCTYLTQIATWYAILTGKTREAVISRFFGIFFMFFQSCGIWGNLLSSTIFAAQVTQPKNISADQLLTCGPMFYRDAQENNTNLDRPVDRKVYIMVGCCISSAVLAFIIIAVFLDQIHIERGSTSGHNNQSRSRLSLRLLVATFSYFWNSHPLKLLALLSIYSGVQAAFLTGDYTKSYIGCSVGLWNIGYVMICYAIVDSICSFSCGRLVEYVGHTIFLVFAAVLHLSLNVALLLWFPDDTTFYVLFVVAALWGVGDAIWQTQINALYGQLLSEDSEAAFANHRLWESLGYVLVYASSNSLRTDVQVYINIAALSLGNDCFWILRIFAENE